MLRIVQVVVLVAIVVGTAWWLVQDLDWATVAQALGTADPRWLLAVGILLGANHVARSLRLQALVEAPVGARDVIGICGVGFLAIQVLPLRIGELVRPQLLVRHGVPFGEGLGAIAVDRVLDVMMLIGLLAIVAFAVPLPAGAIEVQGIDVVAAGQRASAVVVVVAGLALGSLAVAGPAVEAELARLPVVGAALARLVAGIVASLRRLAAKPRVALVAFGWTVLSWTSTIGLVWCAQQAFDGIPGSLAVSLVLWTALVTAMSAVPTPGFFGPFEAAGVAALAVFDTATPLAKAFVLAFHVMVFAFSTAVAVASMLALRLSLDDLRPRFTPDRSTG